VGFVLHSDPSVFVGRQAELTRLRTELEITRTRGLRIVAIQGGAGMGKSSLLARFLGQADLALCLRASGEQSEAGLAWGMLAQLGRSARTVLGRRRVWPSPRPSDDPLVVGGQLLDALDVLQRRGPVALVLDDAHWIDTLSARSILFALRRLELDEIQVLVALRPDLAGRMGEPWGRLLRGERTTRLHLRGLTPAEAVELATSLGIVDLPLAAGRRLVEHTDGNPLHVRALLEELDPTLLAGLGGRLPAPRSFAEVVATRLESCEPETRALLRAAAVLGRRSLLAQAVTVAGTTDVPKALAEAQRERLVSEVAGVDVKEIAFSHPLVQAAIYTGLGPDERERLHRRAAEVVGELGRYRHLLAASFGPDPALADTLEARSGEVAATGDLRTAAAHLLGAARVSPPGRDRERRTLGGVELYLAAAEVAAALEARGDLEALPSSPRRSYLLGHLALWRARIDEAEPELRRAWAQLGDPLLDPQLATATALQLAIVTHLTGRFEESVGWGERALAVGGSDPTTTALALLAWAVPLAADGRGEEALRRLDEFGPAESVPPGMLDVVVARGMTRLWTDAVDLARGDLSVALARARTGESLRMLGQAAGYLGHACYRSGDLGEAVVQGELACGLAEQAGRDWDLPFVHSLIVYPLAARGDLAEAAAHLRTAQTAALSFRSSKALGVVAAAEAALAQATGDVEALAHAARVPQPVPEPGDCSAGPIQAESLVMAGQLESATAALERYEERAVHLQRASALLAAARVRVMLEAARGDLEAAKASYDSGCDVAPRAWQPLMVGRLHHAFGVALAGAGQGERARQVLVRAFDTFDRLGASPDLTRSSVALAELGARPRSAPALLTSREAAVAALTARGMSNRDVAARLVVSVKTVEYHLGHIYAKLGVRSRAELAATMAPGPAYPGGGPQLVRHPG
jgi:ATP/maltotriose-dependent transcriptional regulator MalT